MTEYRKLWKDKPFNDWITGSSKEDITMEIDRVVYLEENQISDWIFHIKGDNKYSVLRNLQGEVYIEKSRWRSHQWEVYVEVYIERPKWRSINGNV